MGKNKSVQNFETHVKSVCGEMGDEEPRKASLLDIAHWFYGEKRLEPPALRDQVRVALGLPPDPPLLAELFVFGVVRNVLAHRTEYEGRIAPRRIPEELALYVSLERRRVVVSPALVSLLDTFTSQLFAGATSSTEPAAAHGMEQLAGTLYRLEVQQRLSLPADVSAPTPMVVPEFARGRSSIGRSLGASALLITAGICALGLIGMAYRRADSSSRGVESSAGTRSSMLARLTAVSPSAASGDLPIFETPESVFDQWSRSARAHDPRDAHRGERPA